MYDKIHYNIKNKKKKFLLKRSCSKPPKALNAVPIYPTAYSWISQPVSCSQKLVLSRTPPFSTHPCFLAIALSSLLIFIGHLLKMPCLSETKGQQPEGSPAPSPTYCSSAWKPHFSSLLLKRRKKSRSLNVCVGLGLFCCRWGVLVNVW